MTFVHRQQTTRAFVTLFQLCAWIFCFGPAAADVHVSTQWSTVGTTPINMSDIQVASNEGKEQHVQEHRQPVFFLTHGAGPCFYMSDKNGPFADINKDSDIAQWFRDLQKSEKVGKHRPQGWDKTKAIVVFSAHWETGNGVISINPGKQGAKHSLYFDYGGFPAETYKLEWPVPGDLQLGDQIRELLEAAKFNVKMVDNRGLDHGVFVPLKLAFPEANIPVVQVSILSSLDPTTHIQIGQALSSLRDEGVLFVASGSATHGGDHPPSYTDDFLAWLNGVICNGELSQRQRLDLFKQYKKLAPHFSDVHPRAEHFIPMAVALGLAGNDPAVMVKDYHAMGGKLALTMYRFGE